MPHLALYNQMVVFRLGRNRQHNTEARVLLTHDTTRPLKQGSLALSSEISSFTTLQRGEEVVRAGSRGKDLPRQVSASSDRQGMGQPGFGMGQGEDQQLSPAARLRPLMPTARTGRLEGRRQGQNRLFCEHPAVLPPNSHFNQSKKEKSDAYFHQFTSF